MIPYHRPVVKYSGSYMLSNGAKVRELEAQIKNLYDVEYVIACSSCTQGLLLALQALKYKQGIRAGSWVYDYISTPAFAWYSSKWAIDTASYIGKYVDISKTSWLMNESKTKTKMPVHTFGNIGKYNGNCIYDGAHALGAKISDFGLATVFSLAPTKLVTSCEGGIIVTNDRGMYTRMRNARDKVSRMSEPNADYGLKTLKSLDDILAWKKKLFNYYKAHLPGQFQVIPHNSNYNTIGFLTDLQIPVNIECRKYYEPLDLSLPNTKYVYNKIVCLPSWYGVDYEKIVNDILSYNEAYKSGRAESYVSEL